MKKQPLSPHLQIYKWGITSLMSIGHRFASVGAMVGVGLAMLYLWCLALGEPALNLYLAIARTVPAKIIVSLLVAAGYFNFFAGLRYVLWEKGIGYEMKIVRLTAWLAIIATLVASALTLKFMWS